MPRSHASPKKTTVPFRSVVPAAPPSSLVQTVKDGFGFGMGSALAHRAVGSIFGAGSQSTCGVERSAFENCVQTRSLETCSETQAAYTLCLHP